MLLFRRNPNNHLKNIPQPFRHEMTRFERKEEGVCTCCGKRSEGILYFCPVCEEFYCLDCAPKSIGGNICPQCENLTFLQRVKEIS